MNFVIPDGTETRGYLADTGHTETHVKVRYNAFLPHGGAIGVEAMWPREKVRPDMCRQVEPFGCCAPSGPVTIYENGAAITIYEDGTIVRDGESGDGGPVG